MPDESLRQKAKQPAKEVANYVFEIGLPHDHREEARRLETDLILRPQASFEVNVERDRTEVLAPRKTQTYASDIVFGDRIMPADTFNAASRT